MHPLLFILYALSGEQVSKAVVSDNKFLGEFVFRTTPDEVKALPDDVLIFWFLSYVKNHKCMVPQTVGDLFISERKYRKYLKKKELVLLKAGLNTFFKECNQILKTSIEWCASEQVRVALAGYTYSLFPVNWRYDPLQSIRVELRKNLPDKSTSTKNTDARPLQDMFKPIATAGSPLTQEDLDNLVKQVKEERLGVFQEKGK